MTENQQCIICLSESPPAKPLGFSCGCSVKVHRTCLDQWLLTSQSACLYCRKPANLLESNRLQNPVEPIYYNPTIINIQVNPLPPTAEPPIQPRERILNKIVTISVCFGTIFGVTICAVLGKFSQ